MLKRPNADCCKFIVGQSDFKGSIGKLFWA